MINEKLDNLFKGWKIEMNKAGYGGFCYDGLIYRNGREDEQWEISRRKIVFLLKEQHNNDGEDVREWSGSRNDSNPYGNFYHRLSAWLYGLSHTTSKGYPPQRIAFDNHNRMLALSTYPYAYMNIKKQSGGARAVDRVIYEHAALYREYLREQLDVLNGNIIVCGGDIVFKAATELIYKDLIFECANDWIYYNAVKKIVLINSYHPSAQSKSNEQMYDWMMEKYQSFLIDYDF
jgi:hypothetical protein